MDYESSIDDEGHPYIKVALSDYALLNTAMLNKGTAFSQEEREVFGLVGLLPHEIANLKLQRDRSYKTFRSKVSEIEKYIYLRDLLDSNETLFYSLFNSHLEEFMPIVYTPVVGLGCQQYSHIYRRPRGLFIAYPDQHNIDRILANSRFDHVKVIVVSDGERILGLGDQGAGGMGISIGKLALYVACAGIHPTYTLPILLDTGTNNENLLNDPLYIGWHHERVRGPAYDDFIERFVNAVKKRFPNVLLHWEDFAQHNANPILARYRKQLCTFNDDIQGTAAVAAGTLLAAIRVTNTPIREQRIVILGAGSAGCGISKLLMQAMTQDGLTEDLAKKNIFLVDRSGLLLEDIKSLQSFQKEFAHSKNMVRDWNIENPDCISILDVVKNVRPTLLIGTSSQKGAFTESIVREMHKNVKRPIIFPLSNPTELSEATPYDLLKWTEGCAIIGTGSPFKPIVKNGAPFRIDQTNNSYIFPGLGLGIISVNAKEVSDKMLMAAAYALSNTSPAKSNQDANLLPPLADIRHVSLQVALSVAKEAINEGLAEYKDKDNLETHIRKLMWIPEYLPYKKWSK